jgi:WS/DGAT/MGAT family acyltransferase
MTSMAKPGHAARVVARLVPTTARLVRQVRSQAVSMPPRPSVRTRFSGRVSPHRSFDTRRFPFAEFKLIKSAVPGATVNDVVLALVAGALREYLESKGELPAENLVSMVPISIRSADAEAGGNRVSAMTVTLPTAVPDPLGRLAVIRDSSRNSKEFTEAIGANTLADISQLLPGRLVGLGSRAASRFVRRAPVGPNTVVTNLPGPRAPLYLAGAQGVQMIGGGPIGNGMGLLHIVGSYCDDFVVSTLACREMMPDPEFYGECLSRSFDALSSVAEGAPPATARTTESRRAASRPR